MNNTVEISNEPIFDFSKSVTFISQLDLSNPYL